MITNIGVLDCQLMFVDGLKSFFQLHAPKYKIKGHACSMDEFVDIIQTDKLDLVIIDLNIPDTNGIEMISSIREHYPELFILVVSVYTDSKLVKNAMVKGADGYVSKYSDFGELIFAIEELAEGNTYIGNGLRTSPPVTRSVRMIDHSEKAYSDSFLLKQKLTKREIEILELIAQGKNNKHIGGELYISDQTVGVHKKNILKKLGVSNTVSLIKYAIENHLV